MRYFIAVIAVLLFLVPGCEKTPKEVDGTSDSISSRSQGLSGMGDGSGSLSVVGNVPAATATVSDTSALETSNGDGNVSDLDSTVYGGYTFVEYEGESEKGDSFLACGTDGRLDRIYADGTLESIALPGIDSHLTQILMGIDRALISGYDGTLIYTVDGQEFTLANKFTDSDIVGLAFFRDEYYACARDGDVFTSSDGGSWRKAATLPGSDIIAISATPEYIAAVSADTGIHMSEDGAVWDFENFNDTYDGFYEKYIFTKITTVGYSLLILGYPVEFPDAPLMMHSNSGGEVWMHVAFGEINGQEPMDFYPISLNHVIYFGEENLAACNNGRVMLLTNCFTCNEISEASQSDLRGIAANSQLSTIVTVGDGFVFAVLDALDVRDFSITPSEAFESAYYYGAVIVDVRSEGEYNMSHIVGALNIPMEEIDNRLLAEVPDPFTQLIIYGSDGEQAKAALKIAQQLGFHNGFNLGGLSDWPYDTE